MLDDVGANGMLAVNAVQGSHGKYLAGVMVLFTIKQPVAATPDS